MSRSVSDVSIGGYIPGCSLLHRLDPRTKLFGAILFLIGIFVARSFIGIMITVCCIALLAALSGVGWRIWCWGLSRFRWMLIITGVVNLLFHSGGTLIILGGWTPPFTIEAIQSSGTLLIRLLAAMVVSMALTFTTTPRELTNGSAWSVKPLQRLNLPVEDMALILLLAMRFVPLLQLELKNTVDAQKARGMDFQQGSMAVRAGNLIAVLIPAVLGTLRRGDLLAIAMTARGFRSGRQRSECNPLCFSLKDAWAAMFVLTYLIAQFILNKYPIY